MRSRSQLTHIYQLGFHRHVDSTCELTNADSTMSVDKTFTAFTAEQAAQYAVTRGGAYPPQIYQAVLDFHHGKRKTFLDVGTGPGKVCWDLLPYFERGLGCDTSVEMIEQAKRDAAKRGVSEKTRFAVSGGEDCASILSADEVGTVDLITVAMAVHWFDMPAFYASAAKALAPGGTLAIWTCSSYHCHPSVPNHEAIQAVLSDLEDNLLGPYMTPGNLLSRTAYETLALPWSIDGLPTLFEQEPFVRRDWDRGGIPSAERLADGTPGPFIAQQKVSRARMEGVLQSSGPLIRFREAHPDKALTEHDPAVIASTRLRKLLGDEGELVIGPSCTLLLLRRQS